MEEKDISSNNRDVIKPKSNLSLGLFFKFSIFIFILNGIAALLVFIDGIGSEYFFHPYEALLVGIVLLTVSYGLILRKYWSVILLGIAFGYSIIRSIIFFFIGMLIIKSIIFLIGSIIVKLIWFDYFYQRRNHFK
tara:strand:- start:122 stop:526 length:405 start_codon:yes stop_codon:yes gene_type:complete